MLALFKKEISMFFSSLTGYLVVSVFLLMTGLFLWVLPGDLNVLFGGYATLDSLFYLAPWIYLFLVPAVTMRLFAEERKGGTLELLLTRPVSELQIVMAKYLAGVALVSISLLPTLLYFWSVYQLGNPVGSIDMGATWGSYIGLFFLAAVYVSIGVFASALTDNQIVAFVVSVVLCFVFYYGFEALSEMPALKSIGESLAFWGINDHYKSVSRGVVDSRDVIYFLSVIVLFVWGTRVVIGSRKWK
ncbi:MAG: gliding motility-associated ABC transporter permease subunit GldF [Marinilabiliaceae bacterium]|nr:gliding motility-associated ABC transporter permease subunit GldF [Marinilabiliaceae bacterium]